MNCLSCGNALKENDIFCRKCGIKIKADFITDESQAQIEVIEPNSMAESTVFTDIIEEEPVIVYEKPSKRYTFTVIISIAALLLVIIITGLLALAILF